MTPPSSLGGGEPVAQPGGELRRVGLEIGQLGEGVEVVAVGGDGAVAPLVERLGARLQATPADLFADNGEHIACAAVLGGGPHQLDVLRQVRDLVGLADAALALEPLGQTAQGLERTPLGDEIEQRLRSCPASVGGPPPEGRSRGGSSPGRWRSSATPARPARRRAGGSARSTTLSTGTPPWRRSDLHGHQRCVHAGEDGDVGRGPRRRPTARARGRRCAGPGGPGRQRRTAARSRSGTRSRRGRGCGPDVLGDPRRRCGSRDWRLRSPRRAGSGS